MGNCLLSGGDYITPAPKHVLPDPSAPSTFQLSRNACMSSNFNVYQGTESNPPLWLFLHSKGVSNGINSSYLVLENFWRPPYSDEGDVLCWCHVPAYQRNRSYSASGYEEYGISRDLYSDIYWTDTCFDQEPGSAMVSWIRKEWSFSAKAGLYRDRYMEEPLGVVEVAGKGWSIRKLGGAGQCLQHHPSKEVTEVRYVFKDKQGFRYPVEMDVAAKEDGNKMVSYESSLFSCRVSPPSSWVGDARIVVSTRPGSDPAVGLLAGFVCCSVFSPEAILSNLRPSQVFGKKIK